MRENGQVIPFGPSSRNAPSSYGPGSGDRAGDGAGIGADQPSFRPAVKPASALADISEDLMDSAGSTNRANSKESSPPALLFPFNLVLFIGFMFFYFLVGELFSAAVAATATAAVQMLGF